MANCAGATSSRRKWPSTRASTQVLAFVASGLVLTSSVGFILWESESENAVDGTSQEAALLQREAERLLDLILDSEGIDMDQGESMQRFGLKGTDGLAIANIQVAQKGLDQGTAVNGYVDADEAWASMGVATEDYGVHLRLTPKMSLTIGLAKATLGTLETALVANWDNLATVLVEPGTDQQMVDDARADLNTGMDTGAAADRAALASIGLAYDDNVHIGATYPEVLVDMWWPLPDAPLPGQVSDIALLEGDVYPDDKDYLKDVLPSRLAGYELLVIGSNVDQSILVAIKQDIADWVTAGGILLVLGSDDASHAWLAPLLTSPSYASDTAPTETSDAGHPALLAPFKLRWAQYGDVGAWSLAAGPAPAYGDFTHPLSNSEGSVVAISEDGTFGGHVILSSLNATAVAPAGTAEYGRFLANGILYVALPLIADVTLDLGDNVPSDVPVAVASRTSSTVYGQYGSVALEVDLLLWQKRL